MNEYLLNNLSKASAETIDKELKKFNKPSLVINGKPVIPFKDPLVGDRLNAKYRELTGKNHPIYAKELPKVVENIFKDKDTLIKNGTYGEDYFSYLNRLVKALTDIKYRVIYVEGHHPSEKLDDVLNHLDDATTAEIDDQLNLFNTRWFMLNGVATMPLNDPFVAEKLNNKYYELTGTDHPVYINELPKVVKNILRRSKDYDELYIGRVKDLLINMYHKKESDTVEEVVSEPEPVPVKNETMYDAIEHTMSDNNELYEQLSNTLYGEEIEKLDDLVVKVGEDIPELTFSEYRQKIMDYFLAEDSDAIIKSTITIDNDNNVCHHLLERIVDDRKIELMKRDFPIDKKFVSGVLGGLLSDYANCSLMDSYKITEDTDTELVSYETTSINGNILVIENISLKEANKLNKYISSIEPSLYDSNTVKKLDKMGGFVNVASTITMIASLIGLIAMILIYILN